MAGPNSLPHIQGETESSPIASTSILIVVAQTPRQEQEVPASQVELGVQAPPRGMTGGEGVTDGVGETDGEADGEEEADGVVDGVAEGVELGVREIDGVAEADALGIGELEGTG